MGKRPSHLIFITRRKCKFGIPRTDPGLHGFRLLARIVEQVVSVIFNRQGYGHRKRVGLFEGSLASLHLAVYGLKQGVQFFVIWTIRLLEGGDLIFMSDSQGGGSRKSKTSGTFSFWSRSKPFSGSGLTRSQGNVLLKFLLPGS